MRLWSIHPSYLDRMGLVSLWREGLLAKNVLEGNTIGYRNHPQLIRFKNHKNPILAINTYLYEVWREADFRGYSFDFSKCALFEVEKIPLPIGQLEYEFEHLSRKLKKRDRKSYEELEKTSAKIRKAHPIFEIVEGAIENWEKV